MLKLAEQDQGLEIGDPIILADQSYGRWCATLALLGASCIADMRKSSQDISQFQVVGDAGTAFTAGHQLALLEAEAADIANGADVFTIPAPAVRMGAILDHAQVMFAGNRHDFFHVRHGAEKVHRDDRLGFGGDGALKSGWVHAKSVRFDIDYHWGGATGNHRGAGGQPGMGRNNDLITLANAKGAHGAFQSDSAIGHQDRLRGTGVLGKLLVKKNFLFTIERPFAAKVQLRQFCRYLRASRWPGRNAFRRF